MGRISHPTDQATVIAGENFTFASELKILEKAVYRGPHYFGRLPMIRIMLDLGRLEDFPTTKLPHFQEKLTALLPSLAEHTCSYGTKGGFLRRIEEGTWLGHVIEHVAIELQFMAGGKATRGKTRSVKNNTGVYNILFAYDTEQSGLWAGRYAIELINTILPAALSGIEGLDHLPGGDKPLFTTVEAAVQKIRSVMNKEKLGPTTQSIVEAAQRRGIPTLRLDDDSLVQLGWGKNQRRIRGSITDRTSQIAVDAACDKALTKELLGRAGLPVPQG